MDILKLDTGVACNESIGLELLSPVDGEPLGIFINIIGKDSQACQDYSSDQIDDALRKAYKAKQRGKNALLQTSAQMRERELGFLATCTVGWSQIIASGPSVAKPETKTTITFGENELVFNHSNAKKLYKRLPWIAEQVDEAIGDLTLFMKN